MRVYNGILVGSGQLKDALDNKQIGLAKKLAQDNKDNAIRLYGSEAYAWFMQWQPIHVREQVNV